MAPPWTRSPDVASHSDTESRAALVPGPPVRTDTWQAKGAACFAQASSPPNRGLVCCSALLLLVLVFLVAVVATPARNVVLSAAQLAEDDEYYTVDNLQKWVQRDTENVWSVTAEVTIQQPIDVVFKMVSTPNLWRLCYPSTLSVGGLAHAPLGPNTPQGMILEKFWWSWWLYSLFRYQVADYQPPNYVTFDGNLVWTTLDPLSGFIKSLGGRFEYHLQSVDSGSTTWSRTVYFYQINDASFLHKLMFKVSMLFVFPTQEKGAGQYVSCVQRLVQSPGWQKELWEM